MKLKKLLAGASLVALGAVTLASCSSNTRNTSVPTGSLDLDSTVATALNGELSLKNSTYYNKLRANGNTIVTNKIKEALYYNELNALKAVFENEDYNNLTEAQRNLIIPTKNDTKLFELSGTELSDDGSITNYQYIRKQLLKTVNSYISNVIYSNTSAEGIEDLTADEKAKKIKSFITARARINQTFTEADLAYTLPTDDSDVVSFDNIHADCFKNIVETSLLTQAEYLSSQNALYQIADEEYIYEYDADQDEDDKTKNSSYYLFDEDGDYLENAYDSTYKTYGTYHAIIIQFDSLKIASRYTSGLDFSSCTTIEEVLAKYVDLYNSYYKYKTVTDYNDDSFTYTVNRDKNDFSDLSDNIKTLVQDTLEEDSTDGITAQYLSEPRNIDNKYVMAIRFNTTYDISGSNEETDWDDLSDDLKAKFTTAIKYNKLVSSASGYSSTNYKSMVYTRSNNSDTSDDIMIYDPIFEYKYENSYADDYELIDKKYFNNDLIFSIKVDDTYTYEYSVEDFYTDATNEQGSSIIYNALGLEYAYKYYDDYVDSDEHDDNVDALDEAIETFNDNKNTSYPKKIGLKNYLLLAYGYDNKEDIIKYYYDAATCFSSYISKSVYSEWGIEQSDGTYAYNDTLETSGILYNLLTLGNTKYSELFSINLDHFLINIDDDGDGSPDDPDEFLSKNNITSTDFENAVVKLAQALYTEAIYIRDTYASTKTLYTILTYIKDQYDLGSELFSASSFDSSYDTDGDGVITWDDFKTYNFLITVEQLASSSDIDQSSVSNFVEPFKDYVIGVYDTCAANSVDDEYEYGTFYVYNTTDETGKVVESESDITIDTLCKTVYGYHLLILNSWDKAEATDFTSTDDPSGIQAAIEVLIYDDEDDDDNDIYVTIDAYNSNTTEISFNQFFIYYCQYKMGQQSSLDSAISGLIESMYSEIITTYTGSNFQNVLLIKYLNIDCTLDSNDALIAAELEYYSELVIDYDTESDYYNWVYTDMDWTRPDQK